jgi:hypothetical protein
MPAWTAKTARGHSHKQTNNGCLGGTLITQLAKTQRNDADRNRSI